jgi:integrase
MGSKTRPAGSLSPQAEDCRNRFLRFFPHGFQDAKYFEWERGYKQSACEQWNEILNRRVFRALLQNGEYFEIAARAVRIESKTNLLFSFEKMALRDAVKTEKGARAFAEGLFALLHGAGKIERKFETWCATLAALPRRQTRVLMWTTATVFPFIAQPETHIFLKPNTTRQAALSYGFDFQYVSKPNWETYALLLEFAETIRRDQSDLRPADMIDLQSFIWVIGSDEYKRMDD